ncbi:transcription factor Zn C2H2 [Fusarium circinatum]|uniref:Transcription factor Zn C2H2 n=1 Tax=Fusarium circinatum TaxID=48490 RepID=A0A8H6CTT9_FUSCI|nr:transcription factor Zn C2H2 [Fusarium circinatum]
MLLFIQNLHDPMDEVQWHTETALPMSIYTITHQCLLGFARIEESNDKLLLQTMIQPSKTVSPLDDEKRIKFDFPALRQNFLYWVQTTGALQPLSSLDEKLKGDDRLSEEVLIWLNVILYNLDRGHLRRCAIEMAHFSAQQPVVTGNDKSFRRDIIALIRDRFPAARQALCRELGESIAKRRKPLLQGAYPNPPLLDTMRSTLTLGTARDYVEYPPLPEVTEFETLVGPGLDIVPQKLPGVQCPFCLCELVLKKPGDDMLALWRHHVDEHIEPYTCVFQNCKESKRYFMHREEWATHMSINHDWLHRANARTWQCDTGHEDPISFEFRSQWMGHMQDYHPELTISGHFDERRESRRYTIRDFVVCPLCEQIPEDAKRMLETVKNGDYEEVRMFM